VSDDDWKVKAETFFLSVLFLIFLGLGFAAYTYHRGGRLGRCTEMCRPAQFDSAQEVNGGCLCIGSDKVLRFKPIP